MPATEIEAKVTFSVQVEILLSQDPFYESDTCVRVYVAKVGSAIGYEAGTGYNSVEGMLLTMQLRELAWRSRRGGSSMLVHTMIKVGAKKWVGNGLWETDPYLYYFDGLNSDFDTFMSCRDNTNKEFADCSIPQEKSNAEINAELDISEISNCDENDNADGQVDSKAFNRQHIEVSQQNAWTLITRSIFNNRRQKSQTVDECKAPEDGSPGCGDECLNRMLSIECVPGTCPCGELCSNQRFQKRSYAKVGWFRCGKKGFGLQLLEDVPRGTFIIEYVGEVLELQEHEARQKEYASRGQKHFYFMTLNSNESFAIYIDNC
eukprot:Gb_36160 [translate_table: standard]